MNWREILLYCAVAALPLCCGLSADRQGLDLVDDGRWLLGAQRAGELHAALAVADAPGRYLLLRACFLVGGESTATLDVLQAGLGCVLALLSFALLRRAGAGRWAWSAPLLVTALGPVGTTAPLLMAMALSLRRPRAWIVAMFGLSLVFGVQVSALGLLLLWLDGQRARTVRPALLGLLLALCAFGLVALVAGRTGIFRDALFEPTGRYLSALASGSPWQWWESLRSGAFPRTPFAGLGSGEELVPLFPAHAQLRWLGFAVLYASVLIAPLALAWRWRAAGQRRELFVLSAVACALLLGRGDVPQLRTAALAGGSLWLLAGPFPRRLSMTLRLAFCAALLVPTLERVWLSASHYRSSLVLWDDARASVLLAATRAQRLNSLTTELRQGTGPLFIWPPAPGLHFLSARPLATRSVVPLLGDDAIGDEIARTRPSLALLAPHAIVGAQALSRLEPTLIEELRLHYRLIGSTVGGADEYRALQRMDDSTAVAALPLAERLPFAEMTVGNDQSPPLLPGFSIGQSLRMASTDLMGISLRWSSPGGAQDVPLRLWIWMLRGADRPVLLQYFDTEIRIARDGHRSYLRFGPVPETKGLDLAVTLEVRAQPAHELRLWMHRHDEGEDRTDFYPQGTVLFHEDSVAADLVFAAY